MKRCPECRRDYYDETLLYCLDDGTVLLEGPASDEPATAMLSATGFPREEISGEGTTRLIAQPSPNNIASKRNSIIAAAVGIAVVTALGIGGYLYYGRGSAKQIDSIAVMPFVNEGGNPDVEYLSDGMTETLIGSLSQIPNLDVKACSSVFRYKGREADAQAIGRELNVQAILNGRVVQRGSDLVLYVELVDASTENSLWKQTYNRTMTNLVALQNDIARDVSNKLKLKLSGEDEQKLAKSYTANPEAYQLYLKGRFYWNKRTTKDIAKSIDYFQQAIVIDPNYAIAYAGLADAYAAAPFGEPPGPWMTKSREAALKALSLDNDLAEAHTALGQVLTRYDYDFASGEREFRRAIELNPNYATAHQRYGELLTYLGRHEESLTETRRTLELEPLSLVFSAGYGSVLIFARRYDEAIEQLKKTLELDANFIQTHNNLFLAYQLKGNYPESIEERARALELNGDNQNAALTRQSFATGGWEGFLRNATGNSLLVVSTLYHLGALHAALGEKDKAFAALEKSYENRELPMTLLKVDPRLDPLRDDPRFQELLRKIGFPE